MCLENLPIVFDAEGRAELDPSGSFGVASTSPKIREVRLPVGARERARDVSIDPVTRVAGALSVHTKVDLDSRVVTEAHVHAVSFRGYEVILRGRDPLQAIDISSRACGVCGGVHATCSAMALEMALGVKPPPLAVVARNLGEAAELVYDHCLHLFLLAGPDYSEAVVRRTTPALWRRAERTPARHAALHGLQTIGEIMSGLNALTGTLYREALQATRAGREIISMTFGKYPHPSTIVPAGLAGRLDRDRLNAIIARIVGLWDYVKRVAAIWEDIVDFFYESDERYGLVGARPANLICVGIWDDPTAYDGRYETADDWGRRRLVTPGVTIDGRLRTTALNQINAGVEEFVDHSFYEQWTDGEGAAQAPDGSPLSPYHPWNKRTVPRPERRSWKERYSWSTAPRWDRQPMESGPLARHWTTATAGLVQTQQIASGDGRLEIHVPRGELPETVLEWKVPDQVNALERNRARAVHVGYALMVAYESALAALDLVAAGETAMASPFKMTDGTGVGYWEAGRGALLHYCTITDGVLENYQIVTPSTWMASPADPWDAPGPYEQAIMSTPILEETRDFEEFQAVDILRAVRSFDPCMPCAVHVATGAGTVIRDATSCACGTDR